jgi:hypothetical protein
MSVTLFTPFSLGEKMILPWIPKVGSSVPSALYLAINILLGLLPFVFPVTYSFPSAPYAAFTISSNCPALSKSAIPFPPKVESR